MDLVRFAIHMLIWERVKDVGVLHIPRYANNKQFVPLSILLKCHLQSVNIWIIAKFNKYKLSFYSRMKEPRVKYTSWPKKIFPWIKKKQKKMEQEQAMVSSHLSLKQVDILRQDILLQQCLLILKLEGPKVESFFL